MKINFKIKYIFFILLFVVFLIPLTSCSSKSNGAVYTENVISQNSDAVVYDSQGRKIIYRVSYNYSSNDIKQTIKDIRNHVIAVSGYISSSYENDGNARYEYKVPTDKLNELVDYIDSLDGFHGKTVDTSDITSNYDYVSTTITRLEARKKIYQDEINNNTNLTTEDKLRYIDLIEDIDSQLQKYYAQKGQMDGATDYSTLYISYRVSEDGQFAKVLGNIVVGSLSFVGISFLIASPFMVVGLVIFLILRKKNKKEEIK